MQVAKWGNSLAVRIPADVARELGIKEGDEIQLCALDQNQVAVITERQRRRAAIEELRKLRWPLPEGYKFTREELYDRGSPD